MLLLGELHHFNMFSFLSVRDSIKLTNKSESTIKRLIREVTSNPAHADRARIRPSHGQVMEHRAANKRYRWTVSEDLLRERFMKESETVPEQSMPSSSLSHEDSRKRSLGTGRRFHCS